MRPLRRLLNASTFAQPPFWTLDDPLISSTWRPGEESVPNDFEAYVTHGMKSNGAVFACMLARQLVFSEVRFQFQRFIGGRPGPLFGDESLAILERPSPTETTGELLGRMDQDTSLAGNWYGTIRAAAGGGNRIRRLRPDWVTILTGSPTDDPFDVDAEPVGLIYDPKGHRGARSAPLLLKPSQFAHFSPLPDPVAQWRGMSWITPVIREIMGDSAATDHKLAFFKRGATPGLAISYKEGLSLDQFQAYVTAFQAEHEGVANAYKTIHVGHGADVTAVGADLRQLDFKASMGSVETRIAAASGLGAVVAQLSEGLQGSSLNAGNFAVARKRAETMLFRPLWRTAAATLERLVRVPDGARLTYDPRDVAFLRDDEKDEAAIRKTDATTMETLYRANFTPGSIIEFMASGGDYSLLSHNGLPSVQVQRAPVEED